MKKNVIYMLADEFDKKYNLSELGKNVMPLGEEHISA